MVRLCFPKEYRCARKRTTSLQTWLRRALLPGSLNGGDEATPDLCCGVAASGAASECPAGQLISDQVLTTRFWLQPRAAALISENLCRHAWWPHLAVVEVHSYQRCCRYGGFRGTSAANYAAKEGTFSSRLPSCRARYFASGWEITGVICLMLADENHCSPSCPCSSQGRGPHPRISRAHKSLSSAFGC
jgi:hypothetical protein